MTKKKDVRDFEERYSACFVDFGLKTGEYVLVINFSKRRTMSTTDFVFNVVQDRQPSASEFTSWSFKIISQFYLRQIIGMKINLILKVNLSIKQWN